MPPGSGPGASLGESGLAPVLPRSAQTAVPRFETARDVTIIGNPNEKAPFDREVSDPAVLEAIEGRGHFQWGDLKIFAKGGYNGLVNVLPLLAGPVFGRIVEGADLPKADIDPRYGGSAIVGEQLLENLALEAGAVLPALGRILGSAVKSERVISAVKAPAFWAVGAGGLGGRLARAGRIEAELSALGLQSNSALPSAASSREAVARTVIAVGDLGSIGTVTSKPSFRRQLTSIINEPSHPLHDLLNAQGKLTSSTARGMSELV